MKKSEFSNSIISKPQNLPDNLLINNGRHNLEDDHLVVCFREYFGAFSIFFLFNYRDNIEFEQRFPDMFQSQYQVCLRYSVTNTQKFGKF